MVRRAWALRYAINMRFQGLLGDDRTEDIYQAYLPRLPAEADGLGEATEAPWATGLQPDEDGLLSFRIPWGAFQLTWRGYLQPDPMAMHLSRFTHVGLLLADGERGEFGIELGGWAAFRYGRHEQFHEFAVQWSGKHLNEIGGYVKQLN